MAAINQFYEKDLQQHGIYGHGTFAEHGRAPTGVNFEGTGSSPAPLARARKITWWTGSRSPRSGPA
jgi:hypothetical protein